VRSNPALAEKRTEVTMQAQGKTVAQEAGKKYFVNTEGTEHPWDKESITVPEIRELGGWDDTQPVLEVNLQDNTERTLAEDEVVNLKPGHGYAKKVKFQRG
jgi:hypothetical protein